MRFGVGFLPGSAPAGQGAGVWLDTLLRLVCRADEMGYEYVQVAEPRLPADGRDGLDPVPLLSAVAALAMGIRDNLSHGRLDVSFHRANVVLAGSPARIGDQVARIADSFGGDVSLRVGLAPVPGTDPERALELCSRIG